MNESIIESLLTDLICAYTEYSDYLNRSDSIQWSEKAEKDAADRYFSIKNQIIKLFESR